MPATRPAGDTGGADPAVTAALAAYAAGAATEHAVSVHGHEDSNELRDEIRRSLKDEMTDETKSQVA